MACPSRRSMAATVELSTPPDMATAIGVWLADILECGRQAAQMRKGLAGGLNESVHLPGRVGVAERKSQTGTGLIGAQTHRQQHVRRLHRAARTGRTARYREAAQIQGNHHRL